MEEEAPRLDARTTRNEASQLMRRILVLNHEVEKQLGRELEVNATDLDAMQHLIQRGPMTPSTLAQLLGISTAAMTVAVDRLAKVGHVYRKPHPTDRRSLLVVPSPQSAQRAMGSLLPMISEIDALVADYSRDQQAAITDYLARIVLVLERKVAPATTEGKGEN
ncbi:MarR family winged helix-turn-helix transcriptional regulator [Paenarthrobacter sp. PH39-S1]|uniref:MarR family winged helix-turn-helix transcriptional regulator n=1 Tax=Micrococcaceae TaxID=1268 RepID=UPI0024B9F4F6|nr:MarR family transcriptional regulator [Paenarthrobacter sp. PH39-S1]MDJ0355912.1 MarR family transcriptional regulator [Paenarthrobacter sp. PH39-S1]